MCLTTARFLFHVLSASGEAKSQRKPREDEEGRTWSDLTARQEILSQGQNERLPGC